MFRPPDGDPKDKYHDQTCLLLHLSLHSEDQTYQSQFPPRAKSQLYGDEQLHLFLEPCPECRLYLSGTEPP